MAGWAWDKGGCTYIYTYKHTDQVFSLLTTLRTHRTPHIMEAYLSLFV